MTKPGRSPRTDGEATRKRILEAAGELFAAMGYAETTSKQIAAAADVDVASINYHFGSRSGLYQAVLVEAHRRLISIDFLHKLAEADMAAEQKLKTVIGLALDAAVGQHAWHTRVLGREVASPSSHLEVLQEVEVLPKLKVIFPILSEITSIAEDDPALLRCLVSVVAPCTMLLVAGQSLSRITSGIFSMSRDDLLEHLYAFSLGGLRAIREDHAKRGRS